MKKISLLFILGIILMASCNQVSPEAKTEDKSEDSTSAHSITDSVRALGRYELHGMIQDFDTVFTEEQKTSLNDLLNDFESKTGNEIVIVTVHGLDTFKNIDDLSLAFFNDLGVGKKHQDNGLLITLCKSCKMVRISTGKGTEKILNNKTCSDVIEKIMKPFFKEGKYAEGVEKGAKEIIRLWGDKH